MKKTFILWIAMLITCMASAQVSTWDGTWEPWTHGTGTEADPFLIENAQQLAYLAHRVNNGLDAGGGHVSNHDLHYKLMIDVNLNGSQNFQWTPIGYWNSNTDYQCFGGHFDGNNHTIVGLYISSVNRAGFFSYTNEASIANLSIYGTVSVTGENAGGLVGYATSTHVENINSHCTISVIGSGNSGGVIGVASESTSVINCFNFEDVSSSNYNDSHSGGIIGLTNGTTIIRNCGNSGNISSERDTGGIVGAIEYHSNTNAIANIVNCFNTGNILVSSGSTSWCYCGGIVGLKYYGTISVSNCYNTGFITLSGTGGYLYAAGIIGANNAGSGNINNSYNIGNITVGGNAGGIGCVQSGSINISNSYYLNTCGGNNTNGGQPMSVDAMQTQEFVDLLNNGTCSWEYDGNNTNSGFPILTGIIVVSLTLNAANITQSHATLRGNLEVENTDVYAQGFEYKKSTDSQYQIVNVSGNGYISQILSGLMPYTEYVYRVFCTPTDCGTSYYGEEKTFTTLQISVTTNNATDVTQTHATLNGNINFGDASITSQGFEYKKTSDSEYQTVVVSGGGNISTTLSDLSPNTQYRFRAFCIPQEGSTIYGQDKTFNTLTINVTTNSASNVTESSATLNGYIDEGDAEVTDKGFKYWPTNEPQNVNTVSVSTTGNISATINNLAQNTYQYRAFAESDGNIFQGGIKEFEISWLNNDTIFVYDADKLHWVAEQCNSGVTFEGKYVKLMNDIDLPFNVPNNMISIGSYPNRPFKGTFDGNGKHITNLYIDQPNTPYQGFFGYTLNANLYNVGLVNITASGRNYTGGMVAYAKNTHLRDCYVNGGTLFALSYCGGLIGYQEQGTNSIVSGCYNTCEVTGNNYVGGLIGFSNYSTVRNSYVAGRVAAQGEPVGAIIGGANEVLMYYCYFSIELTGQTVAIGENNFKDGGEGLTNEQMRDPEFVATLNQGLVVPVWKSDYDTPINNGFPIIVWQEQDITGIAEDNTAIDYISLYPNPANDFVFIQSDDSNVSLKHMEIYDVMGRKVMSETLSGQSQELSIAKLVSGVYHVRVQTSNGCCTNLKLVVE